MKRPALALALVATTLCACDTRAQPANSAARPNIVLVLADDLGWKDVSYNGSGYATPNIDRLAGEGMADRKSTRLNSSHLKLSRMPSSA